MRIIVVIAIITLAFSLVACYDSSINKDKRIVNAQQEIYQRVEPVPIYDYSIPRDVLIQIYNAVTTQAVATYSVVETMTGVVKFYGPSIGYAIPVDTQLTNPLQRTYESAVVEQAEPNGLYTSKNTDGTWVLFVQDDGTVTPVYTEQKVTVYPFPVIKQPDGSWIKAGKASITIDTTKLKVDSGVQKQMSQKGIK